MMPKGFTFDEYKQFVDSVCNRTDPITSGQAVYFTTCFSGMYEFIVDGQANFNNDDFAALANYVKDNVPETGVSWNSDDTDSVADDTPAATRTDLSGIGSYFSSYTSETNLWVCRQRMAEDLTLRLYRWRFLLPRRILMPAGHLFRHC